MQNILIITLPFLIGVTLGWILRLVYSKFQFSSIEEKSKSMINFAKVEAENFKKEKILEAENELLKERKEQEKDLRNQRNEIQSIEKRLTKREESLEEKLSLLDEKQNSLEKREASLKNKLKNVEDSQSRLKKREQAIQKEYEQETERIAQLNKEEARDILFKKLEKKLEKEKQEYISKTEQETYLLSEKKSKEILVSVMQRVASESAAEFTTITIELPSDEMKGRIIGKEGRNVKAFEALTGVNLIIGEAPDSVGISCFDPIRREIAKQSLERLVSDGRINPTRIEETVKKVANELESFMFEQGTKVLYDLKIRMKPEVTKLIGGMYFRTSYGQNMLFHSKEVVEIAEMIAKELGADVEIAKRGAMLHDIGKSIDSNSGISHVEIGVEIAKRTGEDPRVINAIAAHHGEVPYNCIESVIVQIADVISASRPGARREVLETYMKRLEQFENIAYSFKGVSKAYAIQAGRELRIVIDHTQISDEEAKNIARQIANQIENEVKYPGTIKITVIRETRITEYAK